MAAIFALGFLLLMGYMSGKIAEKKGRSFGGFFTLGMFFPIIGLIAAAMASVDQKKKEEQMLKSHEFKKCTACAELVRSDAQICRFCGKNDFVKSF